MTGYIVAGRASAKYIFDGMTLDLTDDETAALVVHLRHALEYDPFPYAPWLDPLKAILAKLDPPAPQPEPLPPIKAGMTPRRGGGGRETLTHRTPMGATYLEKGSATPTILTVSK
jgi:hypothetical protein